MTIDPYILAFSASTVVATIWMGFWAARKSKTAHDFFVAGRSVSVGWNASAISGEYLSAASFMGVAGMVMSSGYDALWYPVCYACGYLFLLLFIAGPLRRFGAYTIPDFAEGRYDSPLFRKIAVVFVLFIGFFYTMPQMKGAGTTLAYIFPGLPYWAGVVLVGAVITLNVALGGMKGITLVQAFQYWAKMFAISVPIFVLMAVYGHYGTHLDANHGNRSAQSTSNRVPLPEKAPRDDVWLNPFGPLTTKAAKAASPRWNRKLRSTLLDFHGQPPPSLWQSAANRAERLIERGVRNKQRAPLFAFADWTNMPANVSRSMPAGFPMLSTLREFGLMAGKPVLVATNLPRPKLLLNGSFHSQDEFQKYLEALFLTNGVRLSFENDGIKALAASDWEIYRRTPERIVFVPNRYFAAHVNADTKALAFQYGQIGGNDHADDITLFMAPDFPVKPVDFNPKFETLLIHEARPALEQTLAENGITLIHASSKEVWAVPTTEVDRYKLPPVNARALSLLYTYSLIIALVCGTAGLPHILVRFYTNPDGVAAKRTTMWVMILIGMFYLFPPVFGVLGRNLLPDLYAATGAKGTDKIVLELPRLLNARHAPLGSILSGITCAGAFAAFMSTFSGLLVSMTGALAHDVYGRMLRPQATPGQRMRMFRICAVIVGGIAVLLGMQVEPFQINFMVGQAFAIAAASYFPLLFMSAWWRGMTMKGAAAGMLGGGLLALIGISLTSFSDLGWINLAEVWAAHPLGRILCEQPAIWAAPLALVLMIIVSKLTKNEVPADIRMKMLVLHAPEKLGLKQEYIQEHRPHGAS